MSSATRTAEAVLTLTAEEGEQLLLLLEQALKQSKIEEHRTDAPDFRQIVRRQEEIFQRLVGKLKAGG
jgi:hypothetical protein